MLSGLCLFLPNPIGLELFCRGPGKAIQAAGTAWTRPEDRQPVWLRDARMLVSASLCFFLSLTPRLFVYFSVSYRQTIREAIQECEVGVWAPEVHQCHINQIFGVCQFIYGPIYVSFSRKGDFSFFFFICVLQAFEAVKVRI